MSPVPALDPAEELGDLRAEVGTMRDELRALEKVVDLQTRALLATREISRIQQQTIGLMIDSIKRLKKNGPGP